MKFYIKWPTVSSWPTHYSAHRPADPVAEMRPTAARIVQRSAQLGDIGDWVADLGAIQSRSTAGRTALQHACPNNTISVLFFAPRISFSN